MPTRVFVLLMLTVLGGCDKSVSKLAPGELPAETAALDPQLPLNVSEADRTARERVVARNWPGLSIAIGWQGRLAWAHAVGFADLEDLRPLTPDMRIRIGPMTQAVTSTLIAGLAADGILDLDAPVGRYLPDLPETYADLTTRELLQHTAGVRDHRGEDEYISGFRHCDTTAAQLALFTDDPLWRSPGEADRHSAYGLVLAAAAAEAAAGSPYEALMEQRVLQPAGMTRTGIAPNAGGQVLGDPGGPGQPKSAGDAWLYWPFAATDTRYGLEHSSQSDLSCVVPAEGLVSTPTDLVRLGNALLAGELVSSETRAAMFTPARLENGTQSASALGWQRSVIRVGNRDVAVYSPGERSGTSDIGPGVPGGTANLALVPELDLVIAAATHVTFARELDDLVRELAKQVVMEAGD